MDAALKLVVLLVALYLAVVQVASAWRRGARARRRAWKRNLKTQRVLRCWARFSLPR